MKKKREDMNYSYKKQENKLSKISIRSQTKNKR